MCLCDERERKRERKKKRERERGDTCIDKQAKRFIV